MVVSQGQKQKFPERPEARRGENARERAENGS